MTRAAVWIDWLARAARGRVAPPPVMPRPARRVVRVLRVVDYVMVTPCLGDA